MAQLLRTDTPTTQQRACLPVQTLAERTLHGSDPPRRHPAHKAHRGRNSPRTLPSGRTSVLGTIVGAAYGKESLPPWLEEGLYNTKDIKGEVDALLVAVQGAAADLAAPGADGCEAK